MKGINNLFTARTLVLPATLAALFLALAAGCGREKPTSSQPGTTDAGRTGDSNSADTAEQVRDGMLAAYRSARTYRDSARIVLSYRQDGRQFNDEAPISVYFERPNRIRIEAYQVKLTCDGKELHGSIADPSTNQLDGQFLVRPAPVAMQLDDLLDDPLVEDQIGNALVVSEAGRVPLQLALLLADKPIGLLSGPDVELTLAARGSADGHACHRLESKGTQGVFRFWIDVESFVLRKLEYPRDALVPRLAKASDVRDVQLVAIFTDAEIGLPENNDSKSGLVAANSPFRLTIPEMAKQVRFFVPPPQPLPTDKFGQAVGSLGLTTPGGEKVTRQSLQGRIAALLWFSSHAECEPSLRRFSAVRERFADERRIAFYAVSTEPSTVSHQQLRDLLRSWHADTPLTRDLAAHGRDLLGIDQTPTLVVLNETGELQLYEVGVNPRLDEELPIVLEKLLNGEDLAAAVLRQFELERDDYARRLRLASSENQVTTVDVPEVPVAAAAPPSQLRLTPRWKVAELKQAGNLVVIPAPLDKDLQPTAEPRLLILVQGRRLVELNLESGQPGAVIEFDLPVGTSVQHVRTVVNQQGQRYFAAWSAFGRYVHLFGEDGQQRWQYPPDDARHEGVRDVLLADLDANGTPECYVGFLGSAGLHSVALDGSRSWGTRSLGTVLALALTPPNPVGWKKILALGDQGSVSRVNQFGNADPAQRVAGWSLATLIHANGNESDPAIYCGLGFDRQGKYCAVALNERLTEDWNYPLPEGVWRTAIEPIQTTTLLGPETGGWLIAAADGGVHLISGDGSFADHWHLGYVPAGLASLQTMDGHAVVVVAGELGVEAWNVGRDEQRR